MSASGQDVSRLLDYALPHQTTQWGPLAVVPCSGDASHPVELFLTRVNVNNHSVLKSAQSTHISHRVPL